MYRLSSNSTLMLKIFIPVLWLAIFGMMTIVIFVSKDSDTLGLFNYLPYKLGFLVFYLGFAIILYFSLWQLKRVEADTEHTYVTNYFKTVKMGIGNIEKVTEIPLGIATLVTFRLRNKSSLGKKIYFIAKRTNYDEFVTQHQEYLNGL